MISAPRNPIGQILCLCLALATGLRAQEAPPTALAVPKDALHVYLLIGQSNMAGRAPFTEAESGLIERCYLLNDKDLWEPASNPLNRHSTIRKGLNMQKMGPGYAFAKTLLASQPDISIGLVVNAKGGTRIEEWGKGTRFYQEALRRAGEARKNGTLKGILWHQGESNSGNPDDYLGMLSKLISDLRADLNAPNLPFVAGQVFHDPVKKPNTKAINEQIARLPQAVPFTGCARSEGLTSFDNTHFDLQGVQILGQRYAEEMLALAGAAAGKTTVVGVGDPSSIEQERIDALITHVANMKEETFIRNGKTYDASTAATFLRRKLQSHGSSVTTATEFIEQIGTMSSTTGRPYLIRRADGTEIPCAAYLGGVLHTMTNSPVSP